MARKCSALTLAPLLLVSHAYANTGIHLDGPSLRSSLAVYIEFFNLATYKNLEFMLTWQALAARFTRSILLLASNGHSVNQQLATISKAMLTASLRVYHKPLSRLIYWK